MNVFWILILILSISINFLVLIYDIIPFAYNIVKRKLLELNKSGHDLVVLEEEVVKRTKDVLKNKKSIMVWSEPLGLAHRLNLMRGVSTKQSFRNYNYPRALLFSGVSLYALSKKDENTLQLITSEFGKLIDESGNPSFNFNKVDQASFGLTSLVLWNVTKEEKYMKFANYIYKYLYINYKSHNGVILYRNNQYKWLNDMIGLVIPFLVEYYKHTKDINSISIVKEQMDLFVKYGIDKRTFMPAHGVDLDTKIMIGSSNWGRGIGWYFMGLKALYEFDKSFEKEYLGLSETLMSLRNKEGLWSQFPGSNEIFDASTTTMFLYCLPKDNFTKEEILTMLDKYISKDGFILQTSGDTYGANSYSKTFGKSELSQGMLMSVLSRYN